ncbi:MAG: CpsD/CapB family tyrosine-protein kinase [Terriglobales bacterium]
MSHIFDALQRAEAEQAGDPADELSLANELLRIAESRGTIPAAESLPDVRTPAPPPHPQTFSTASPFDQFESLPVSLVPDSKLVSITEKDSLAAEKFRFLAVRLRQQQQVRPLKKVLITSTIPGEGKSTVAANLACTLARRRQQRTLLLDGDLRRPTLARLLGLGRVPGVSEALQGSTDLVGSIYRLDALGLWILPAGNAPQNPLELMQSGKLAPVMEQLTIWFDWIVIDSPPVLPLADTSVWGRLADGILLVTRQGTTEKKQLKRGLEAFESSKLLGALVNGSDSTAHSNYYQHYNRTAISESTTSPGTSNETDPE